MVFVCHFKTTFEARLGDCVLDQKAMATSMTMARVLRRPFATFRGLDKQRTMKASLLGLGPDAPLLFFGHGPVNTTLMALCARVSTNLTLCSTHAPGGGTLSLEHGGDVFEVDRVTVVEDPDVLRGSDPAVIVNGRQLGGNYDEIFDAVGPATRFLVCAQNGPSSRMVYAAADDYCERHPDRAALVRAVVGVDAAMFVKTSFAAGGDATRSRAVMRPGARWVFGAFSLEDGAGSGGRGSPNATRSRPGVDGPTLAAAEDFADWFRLLGATDGDPAAIELRPEAVSGKLAKTADNIGANYGAAIATRLAANYAASIAGAAPLAAPLPQGIMHDDFDLDALVDVVGAANLDAFKARVADVRALSRAAVGEFYDLHAGAFAQFGIAKATVLSNLERHLTEESGGVRAPSRHPPTHAVTVFERRPSEPLLQNVLAGAGSTPLPHLRALRDAHREVEVEAAVPYDLKAANWLDSDDAKRVGARVRETGRVDFVDLASLTSVNYGKPNKPLVFSGALAKMGEHAINYMERVTIFRLAYDALEADEKPPFLNLTIGGVYRETAHRVDANASRGYVTHLAPKDKEVCAAIFSRLGVDLTPDQACVSPMRAKVALQHAMGLFKPGAVVAHAPAYKSTVDSAVFEAGHRLVDVDVRGRFGALFDAARDEAAAAPKGAPVVLLLVDPHNPGAISMTDDEEAALHALITDCPNVSVVHDIAYQGYHATTRDAGKRYRDDGMPHPGEQIFLQFLSTSKSMYASGQPALYAADKHTLPFLQNHYARVATGPTSTFVHDLPYYHDTLDDDYMPSVERKLQRPLMAYVDEHKDRWGVDYLVRPDGPPFVTLDVRDKIDGLGLTSKGFRELTLRCAMPCLVDSGNLRLALTGFDKATHDAVLPLVLDRLDFVLSLEPDDEIVRVFKAANPWYRTKVDVVDADGAIAA